MHSPSIIIDADSSRIGREIGVDPEVILATSHGRRSIDVLKIYEPKKANWECTSSTWCLEIVANRFADIGEKESQIPIQFGADAVEIPGSRSFLEELEKRSIPWAIVTSGTRPLVTGWLDVLKLAHPKNLVTAEDVDNGKPDPACYLLGRKKLALPDEKSSITVFEDAPAGIKSGKAAGFTVIALHTTHTLVQLKEAGADFIVQDMRSVSLKAWDSATGEIQLEISNALVW